MIRQVHVTVAFTALLPAMSERWSDRDTDGVRDHFSLGLRDTVVVIVPAAFAFLVLAGPIVSLLLEYGAATPADARLIARTTAPRARATRVAGNTMLHRKTSAHVTGGRTSSMCIASPGAHTSTSNVERRTTSL